MQLAVTASGRRPSAAATATAAAATPTPLLPFWHEFRSQVARLEGVEALPLPPLLEAAHSPAPAVGIRCGTCHADRLRFGHVLYVNAAGGPTRGLGRPRTRPGAAPTPASSRSGSLALLQGQLLPSLYSFHPALTFQVVAWDGGDSWMLSVDQVPLAELPGGVEDWQEGADAEPSSSSSGGGGGSGSREVTPAAWQWQQAQRLAAVPGMFSRVAVPPPASPLRRRPGGGWPSSAHCLLSSAELGGEPRQARCAALESAALPAFRAALSVHLNGLARAPADASPAHVRRCAAAQLAHLQAVARRPLLAAAQLSAAFGRQWCAELQEHLAAASQLGLEEVLAAPTTSGGDGRDSDGGSEGWVYLDPARLFGGGEG